VIAWSISGHNTHPRYQTAHGYGHDSATATIELYRPSNMYANLCISMQSGWRSPVPAVLDGVCKAGDHICAPCGGSPGISPALPLICRTFNTLGAGCRYCSLAYARVRAFDFVVLTIVGTQGLPQLRLRATLLTDVEATVNLPPPPREGGQRHGGQNYPLQGTDCHPHSRATGRPSRPTRGASHSLPTLPQFIQIR